MSEDDADVENETEPRFQQPASRTDVRLEPGGVIDVKKDGKNNWGLAARWFLLSLLAIAIIWGLLAIAR